MSWRAQADPILVASYVASGARIAARRVRGPTRFRGSASDICRQAVEACWTGSYLAASGGHFRQFWTRDLGFAAPSLLGLGQGDRVRASLAWALDAWARSGHVTTTIFAGRRPRDVWTLGVDSLPLLLATLRIAGAEELLLRHGAWLQRDLDAYLETVVDTATGLVRDDRHLSTHRDTVRTRSNTYANAMLVLLDDALAATQWFDRISPTDVRERFLERSWAGDRMVDRPDTREVTGDAAVVPFVFGVAPDELLAPALAAARDAGLTDPLPLRYAADRRADDEDPLQRRLVPDYQGTAIWTSLGAWYLQLLWRVDARAAGSLAAAYARRIEADGTVWEVFDGRAASPEDLRPYRGRGSLFVADEAMLWAAVLATAMEGTTAVPEESGPAAPSGSSSSVRRPAP
jgi:hypothetical protein